MFNYLCTLESFAIFERLERRGSEKDETFKIIAVSMNSNKVLIRSFLSIYEVKQLLDIKEINMIIDMNTYLKIDADTMFNIIEQSSKE